MQRVYVNTDIKLKTHTLDTKIWQLVVYHYM